MPLLQENRVRELKASFENDSAQKQSRQMLIALTLLLAALIAVLTKDREFWFRSTPALQSELEPTEEIMAAPKAQPEAATTTAKAALSTYPKAKPHTVRPPVAGQPVLHCGPRGDQPNRPSAAGG